MRLVVYLIIKHLPNVYVNVLGLVCKEWQKAVKMRNVPKPNQQEWLKYIADKPELLRWYKLGKYSRQLVGLTIVRIPGHDWEQRLYQELVTGIIIRMSDAYKLAKLVGLDGTLDLRIISWLSEKWPNLSVNSSFIQVGSLACTPNQCTYVIHDLIKMVLPGLITGWKEVGKKVSHFTAEIDEVVAKLELLLARIDRNSSLTLLKLLKKQAENGAGLGSKVCYVCGGLTLNYRQKGGYICAGCFKAQPAERPELLVGSHMKSAGIHYISTLAMDSGFGVKKPDFYIPGADRDIIIECDENQHVSYGVRNEWDRMRKIANSSWFRERNLCFIRFNPDSYVDATGRKVEGRDVARYIWLINVIEAVMRAEVKRRVEVVYLYYDGYRGQIEAKCLN